MTHLALSPAGLTRQQPPEPPDPRVTMVLEVLRGADPAEVAARWVVDPELVRRWVHGFLEGGSAIVTNRPLAAAARERDRFLSAFAHELRTPLAVAQAWVEMLGTDDLSPQLRTRGLVTLQGAVARLTERVAEIELLAAASLGRIELDLQRVGVADIASPVPSGATIEIAPDASHLLVDPEKFRHVVKDLWKAAALPPTPRSLRLEAMVVEPWIEIRVTREADPLDPTLLHALLEPFSFENANSDGSGITIGLYLARALTTAHGGTIGLEQDDDRLIIWVRVPHHPSTSAGDDVTRSPHTASRLDTVTARPAESLLGTTLDLPVQNPTPPSSLGLTTGARP